MIDIPDALFKGLSYLEILDLRKNFLTKLNKDIFGSLKNLNTLDLSENKLMSFPETLFYELSKLKVLDFYRNNLTILPPNIFSKLLSLEELCFFGNNDVNVWTLPQEMFTSLPKLKTLSTKVHHNNIVMINELEYYIIPKYVQRKCVGAPTKCSGDCARLYKNSCGFCNKGENLNIYYHFNKDGITEIHHVYIHDTCLEAAIKKKIAQRDSLGFRCPCCGNNYTHKNS